MEFEFGRALSFCITRVISRTEYKFYFNICLICLIILGAIKRNTDVDKLSELESMFLLRITVF